MTAKAEVVAVHCFRPIYHKFTTYSGHKVGEGGRELQAPVTGCVCRIKFDTFPGVFNQAR